MPMKLRSLCTDKPFQSYCLHMKERTTSQLKASFYEIYEFWIKVDN